MKYTVTVLQDDIDNGEKREAYNCAIARAAKRDLAALLPEEGTAAVGCAGALTLYRELCDGCCCGSGPLAVGQLPPEAVRWFLDWDRGLPVEPFKFEVELESRPG